MIARELYTHEGTSWNLACNQVRTGCSSFKSLLTPTNVFSTSNISRSWEEESSSLMSIFKAGSGVDSKLPTRAKIIMDSNFPPAFTMGSIYGDCWHFFRLHQGKKWAWKYIIRKYIIKLFIIANGAILSQESWPEAGADDDQTGPDQDGDLRWEILQGRPWL